LSIALFERAIESIRVTEGENSLAYAEIKVHATSSYMKLGQYDKAEEYLVSAL